MTIRKLTNANITHVSYVDKGANKKQFFLTKSEEDPDIEKDVKIHINKDDEKQLVYGVVYEPNVPDAHNDYMEAGDIEKSAHTFLAEYRQIDKQHDFQGGYGEVVESYVAPQDFEVGGETITKGSWVLVTKASDEVWEQIKKGEITGYSMAGTAEVEEVEKQEENMQRSLFKILKDFFSKGEFIDTYNATRKRRNMFDAIYMFEDFISEELWNDEPDVAKISEYTNELGQILTTLASSEDIIKELKDDFNNKEEIQLKKEDLQEVIKEALEPINEKLEKLEKEEDIKVDEVEKEEEKSVELDAEKLAKQVGEIVKESLKPIIERLETVEKARGISKSVDADAEVEPKGEEESVFKDLFTYRGQL